MDKERIVEISNDVKNRPNADLFEARDFLRKEFDDAKGLIINLTRHVEAIEGYYEIINDEIKNRLG